MRSPPPTLLIIHPGSLGDSLLALPAIRAIRASFPHHHIVLDAQESAARLLHSCGEVDQFISIHGTMLAELIAGGDAINQETRAALARCDIAVVWMNDPHGELASTFARFGVRCIVTSPHKIEMEEKNLHQSDRFLETVKAIVSTRAVSRGLALPSATLFEADARLREIGVPANRPLIIIHPGSGSPYKCVAPDLLADIIQWYRERNVMPLIVSGPADGEHAALLERKCQRPILVLHTSDLQVMAGILARADLFIGHDSGLTHLASALAISTVALFGPTHHDRWAPRGSHVRVVTGLPCRCEGWEEVRSCRERSCLKISCDRIIEACTSMHPTLI